MHLHIVQSPQGSIPGRPEVRLTLQLTTALLCCTSKHHSPTHVFSDSVLASMVFGARVIAQALQDLGVKVIFGVCRVDITRYASANFERSKTLPSVLHANQHLFISMSRVSRRCILPTRRLLCKLNQNKQLLMQHVAVVLVFP